jgi:hypothetical protein
MPLAPSLPREAADPGEAERPMRLAVVGVLIVNVYLIFCITLYVLPPAAQ